MNTLQAVALTTTGSYIGLYACGIYGYQDTLYAKSGYQYFSRCYIEGLSLARNVSDEKGS